MQHVADRHHPSGDRVVEPQQNSADQKDQGAYCDGPKIELLAAVEESCIFRRQGFFVNEALASPTILIALSHPIGQTSSELKENGDVENQTPTMKKRASLTTKEWCEPRKSHASKVNPENREK